jgi:hypothetical protein
MVCHVQETELSRRSGNMGIHGHLIISSTATRGHLADNACGTELENIVIPERDTYEDIDDVYPDGKTRQYCSLVIYQDQ